MLSEIFNSINKLKMYLNGYWKFRFLYFNVSTHIKLERTYET